MSGTSFDLVSLRPIHLQDLPEPGHGQAYDDLIRDVAERASAFLATLTSSNDGPDPSIWSKGKVYNKSTAPTQCYSAAGPLPGVGALEGRKWHTRISRHPGADFDQWRSGLLIGHSSNEQLYVESCIKAERLHAIKQGELEVWRTNYRLPFPTSNRDFAFAIFTLENSPVSREAGPRRSFVVVSVPFDAPKQHGFLRAKYVAIEQVSQVDDGIEWIMSTASDAGGLVPRAISEIAMPSKIAEDVPSFTAWLASSRSLK